MRRAILAATAALLLLPGAAQGATFTGIASAYSPCDGSTTMTASGRTVREGYVAQNSLPLGSWIEMKKPARILGRSYFRVMDRGSNLFSIDIWTADCAWMNSWGRRTVTYRSVPRAELYRGRPYRGWTLGKRGGKVRLTWRPWAR